MNNVLYQDDNLEITEMYVRFVNQIMPTSALSFVSVSGKKVSWWLPIVLIIASVIGFFMYDEIRSDLLLWIAIGLSIYGIYQLIDNYIESRKTYFSLISHSGNSINFEIDGDYQQILNAVYVVIEGDDEDEVEETEENSTE